MHLTDEELIIATRKAREDAHKAPRDQGGSRAWADRANDWMRFMDECERRGIKP